jgi:predicted SprT family Zn-dependent metalloprotease
LSIRRTAQQILDEVLENHPEYREHLAGTTIAINPRFSVTAGRAWWRRRHIELSGKIFKYADNIAGLPNTVKHEAAHIIANNKYGKNQHHNRRWRNVFLRLGGDGKRCHDFSLPEERKRKPKAKYEITLECCGERVLVGAVRHRRWLSGTVYRHPRCKK